jgi:LPXTG-motif cell wall-anchored protein
VANVTLRFQPLAEHPVDLVSPNVAYDCKAPSASPSASRTASPSASRTASPSASPSASRGVPTSVPPGAPPGGSFGLPKTGANVLIIAGAAGTMLTGGIALLALVRRRRDRFVA